MKELRKQQLILMMKHPIPKSKIGIVHLKVVREETALFGTGRIQNASEAAKMVRPLLEYSDREGMICLALDQTHSPIALEIVAVGSLNVCGVDIRDIFKHAILSNAASIICFHNHPSGSMEASPEDIRISSRIRAAGSLSGVYSDYTFTAIYGYSCIRRPESEQRADEKTCVRQSPEGVH